MNSQAAFRTRTPAESSSQTDDHIGIIGRSFYVGLSGHSCNHPVIRTFFRMDSGLQTLFLQREAESRSISAENPDGSRGGGGQAPAETTLHAPSAHHARELGTGWKISPCRPVRAGDTVVLMDERGQGVIRHIWMTLDPKFYRDLVLRIYWDGSPDPSVECPIGDFFCCAWGAAHPVESVPVNVNPKGGLNSYLPMPFRECARVEVSNSGTADIEHFFYTIDYSLERLPENALYLHARFHRTPEVIYGSDYLILDGVRGSGHYVGTFMAWEQHSSGWWGEGEIKIYLDDDSDFPTICGTGTEDYFGGAWCFGKNFSAPYLGYRLVSGREGEPGARMSMYRFHVPDPIFFRERIRITIQALGWQSEARYRPLEDDISSVAFWYQTIPHRRFPPFPDPSICAITSRT